MFKVLDETGSGIITEERHLHLTPVEPMGRAVELHVTTSSESQLRLTYFALRAQKVG